MNTDTQKLISKGTNDTVVAKNWHLNNIPAEAQKLISNLKDIRQNYTNPDDIESLDKEILGLNTKLESFLNQFPAPKSTAIKDRIEICDILPAWQKLLPLHYRPVEPLTLLNDDKNTKHLFYRKQNHEVIKVINMPMNRPNSSELLSYSY